MVAVAYKRWLFTKDSSYSDLIGKTLVFWESEQSLTGGGCFQEVVALGGSTVFLLPVIPQYPQNKNAEFTYWCHGWCICNCFLSFYSDQVNVDFPLTHIHYCNVISSKEKCTTLQWKFCYHNNNCFCNIFNPFYLFLQVQMQLLNQGKFFTCLPFNLYAHVKESFCFYALRDLYHLHVKCQWYYKL